MVNVRLAALGKRPKLELAAVAKPAASRRRDGAAPVYLDAAARRSTARSMPRALAGRRANRRAGARSRSMARRPCSSPATRVTRRRIRGELIIEVGS